LFRVIEGGLAGLPIENDGDRTSTLVAREGKRRLEEIGVPRFENRKRLTGLPMPPEVTAFKLQIEFAVRALSQLSPLPEDYTSDGYWPSIERATSFEVALG
jgi:hypothetical protein